MSVVMQLRHNRRVKEPTPTELLSAWAERLQELRKLRGFSKQADLAAAIRVSHHTVNKWEMGRSFPRPPELWRLCHMLGTTADYLLFGETRGLTQETIRLLTATRRTR